MHIVRQLDGRVSRGELSLSQFDRCRQVLFAQYVQMSSPSPSPNHLDLNSIDRSLTYPPNQHFQSPISNLIDKLKPSISAKSRTPLISAQLNQI